MISEFSYEYDEYNNLILSIVQQIFMIESIFFLINPYDFLHPTSCKLKIMNNPRKTINIQYKTIRMALILLQLLRSIFLKT